MDPASKCGGGGARAKTVMNNNLDTFALTDYSRRVECLLSMDVTFEKTKSVISIICFYRANNKTISWKNSFSYL